jgi:hypothetical protein
MKVLGKNGVSIFRLDEAEITAAPWSIGKVGFSYLTDGDAYHLGTHRTFIAASKHEGAEPASPGSIDAHKIAGPFARLEAKRAHLSKKGDTTLPSLRGAKLSFRR